MATGHRLAAVRQRQAPRPIEFSQSDAVPDLSFQEQAALPENTSRRGAVSLALGCGLGRNVMAKPGVQKHRQKLSTRTDSLGPAPKGTHTDRLCRAESPAPLRA